jgi:hemoglobin
LSAALFQHWLALFHKTTDSLPNEAMRERANDLAGRVADSLWYGYQLSRQPAQLPEEL